MDPRVKEKARPTLLCLVILAWMLPGLLGHDPWKPDESYTIGLVHNIVASGDWVVPAIAGEPFMEKPPVYYIAAAWMVRIFSPWLPEHDAARLASALYLAIALLFAGMAAREMWGTGHGWPAALALIGTPGLLLNTHKLITDVALFAGFAVAFYGFSLWRRRPARAGFFLGTGVGIGFLAKGLIAPGTIGITALCLPGLFREWRKREYAVCLGAALVSSLPWLLVWPLVLYRRSPELFMEWLWVNNFGRFAGFAHLGPKQSFGFYLRTIPYFTLPALPLAAGTIFHGKRTWWREPSIQFPLCGFLVILSVLMAASDSREVYALPLLLPLGLLSPPAAARLSDRLSDALNRSAAVLFGILAAVVWAAWAALMAGEPAALAEMFRRFSPAWDPRPIASAVALAAVITLLWLLAAARAWRGRESFVFHWAIGVTMVWGITMTLWLPWLDSGKAYRGLHTEIRAVLPSSYRCIASRNLAEEQRALLDYYFGIRTRRTELFDTSECDLLLVQNTYVGEKVEPGPDWNKRWEGSRKGDGRERFYLFERVTRDRGVIPPSAPAGDDSETR